MTIYDDNMQPENVCFPLKVEKEQRNSSREISMKSKLFLTVVAQFFATLGSVLGKFAGGVQVVSLVTLLLKLIFLILMVTSNTIGCTFFVKVLNASSSSLPCTIASTAASFVFAALVGSIIFGESTSATWWCGVVFVILGLLLTCWVPTGEDSTLNANKSKQE